ncbi:MAG: DUF2341 domain-containing protein, partial [Kiritimatiellaeota bacterium]|nr:DUF2341 domain-containing protein [Kiritimatiellota bacterium]
MKRMVCCVCAAAVCAAMSLAGDMPAWDYRMMVVFNGHTGAETLANFPALVRLNPNATTNMLENGADLRFTDAAGNVLAHEIDTWDTNGLSTVWVNIASFEPRAPIFAYWGNPLAIAPENSADVWGEYAGVWHLGEALTSFRNSTATGLDGDRGYASPSPGVVTGGQLHNNAGVRIPHHAALNLGDTFSVSAWFKLPDDWMPNTEWIRFFCKKGDWQQNSGWEVENQNANYDAFGPRGDGGGNDYIGMPEGKTFYGDPREWHHLTVQFKGQSSGSVYVDGVLAGDTTLGYTRATHSGDDFYIGNWHGH